MIYQQSKLSKLTVQPARRILIAAFMLLSVVALSLPGQSANAATDFCYWCEDKCYRESENVKDYNACITWCNYAGNCHIPYIH